MDECIESIGNAKVFSKLEANRGYWNIEIDPKDPGKTVFTPHHRYIVSFEWISA